jgi:hypothetical protein
LLLLGVPERAVMDLMGWSNAAMVRRCVHVTARLRRDIADRLNAFLCHEFISQRKRRRYQGTAPAGLLFENT